MRDRQVGLVLDAGRPAPALRRLAGRPLEAAGVEVAEAMVAGRVQHCFRRGLIIIQRVCRFFKTNTTLQTALTHSQVEHAMDAVISKIN